MPSSASVSIADTTVFPMPVSVPVTISGFIAPARREPPRPAR